ncbi:MAG TPA: maltose ABC transporter substrate-binding protein [Ilumatobacteraceae bacterium]|nr:maltose ABC transporter substrate-binding protein [Ilumatobacteraceae bacterium]
MRVPRRLIAFAAVAALVGAACGSDDDEATGDTTVTDTTEQTETTEAPDSTEAPDTTDEATTETTEYQPPARGDADLVIWADDTRAPVLEPIAAAFSEAEGVNVQVLEVPFDQIRDNLSIQGPAGEGPDIIIGAHDWLGELVSNGVVEPIDLGPAADQYAEVAVQAFTYDGQVYGLPYAIENIALIRNTDLVPEAPATFEDLEATALALLDEGTVDVPLAVQQGPADPYHNYPLFSAAGGYVFGQTEDGSYVADDLGIDSEGGLAAAQKFADWSNSGLISKDVTYDIMIDSFSSGRAPFAITGPWAISSFEDVNFVVEPIPPVAGGTAQPFVGVQGFMISSFSEATDLAKTFLLDYLNTEELQLALYDAGGRPPAMTSAFEQVSTDPIIEGFGLSGQDGSPLPAIPAMSAVWDNWTDAYNLIFTGTDPTEAFTTAAEAIRQAIAEG